MILDAASLLCFFDRNDRGYWSARGRIEFAADYEHLVVSPFVIAELEQLVEGQFGREGWLQVFEQLAGGAWTIGKVDLAHLVAMRARIEAGETVASASVAVLGEGN